ncbi:MAG TPA: transferrin-binding protein-like solute binding protein [Rhizomicrobium sp.]|nr:transferrin-binding protein-like solute binding protein [Rhizomicrobium sp.]
METVWKGALRLTSSVCLVALTACSGGGGGGGTSLGTTAPNNSTTSGNTTSNSTTSNNTTSGNATSNNTTSSNNTTTTTPTVSIGSPDPANVVIVGSPAFNFTNNLPPVGTVFGLLGPAVKTTPTAVTAANAGSNGTATFRGMVTSGSTTVPTFDLSIPAIGLNATNVRADGSTTTLSDGSAVILTFAGLTYTAQMAWGYKPAGSGAGTGYIGVTVGGSGTTIANVPTAGSANYAGNSSNGGGVGGAYFVPDGNGGIATGSLAGNVAMTANFSSGAITGNLSNMIATPAGGGSSTAWNTVSLSANIARAANNASFTGTTSTGGAPAGAGAVGFSSSATGGLTGSFFGPNINEAGGTWTLTDPNAAGGGKTAFGAFAGVLGGNSGLSGSPSTVSIAPPSVGVSGFNNPGSNFTTNPPPVGTSFPLGSGALSVTGTSVADANVTQATATYRGTVTNGGTTYPVFDLSIPYLSLNASNVRGDGTPTTTSNGGQVSASVATMTYTMFGAWNYAPSGGGTSYLGQLVAGYDTPASGVPTSGSATYTGTAAAGTGVVGVYAVPSGTSAIQTGTLTGDASVNTNFTSNSFTGSFTNMQAKAMGSSTATPWNNVSLSGNLMRQSSGAVLSGTTATTGAPAGAGSAGFSSAATGTAIGQFNGPSATEIGGIWTLAETAGGGKAAFGTFGVTTTTP